MKLLLFFLLISTTYASEFPQLLPGEAGSHAQEALYIQSGLNNHVSNLSRYGNEQLKHLGIEKEATVSFFLYKTYTKQSLSLKYHGNTIEIRRNQVNLSIPF